MQVRTPQTHPDLLFEVPRPNRSIFLAGSIEMGKAEPWQDELISFLSSKSDVPEDLIVFNPRRDDWDSSWKTGLDYDENFSHQVHWELRMQEQAKIKTFYFAKDTLSPITLLEFGLQLSESLWEDEEIIIYLDPGYLRGGNVAITARYFGQTIGTSKEEFFERVYARTKAQINL